MPLGMVKIAPGAPSARDCNSGLKEILAIAEISSFFLVGSDLDDGQTMPRAPSRRYLGHGRKHSYSSGLEAILTIAETSLVFVLRTNLGNGQDRPIEVATRPRL
jgi:hypothetical protein